MNAEAVRFSRDIREHNTRCKPAIKSSCIQRFRCYIEHSNWDEAILSQDEWIDIMCVAVIIITSLYFIPVLLVMLFLR
jgi:hypothetical protein